MEEEAMRIHKVGYPQIGKMRTNAIVKTPRFKVPFGQYVVCPLIWLGFKTPKPVVEE